VRRVARTARNTDVVPPPAYSAEEMRAIRQRLGVSQSVFAQLLHASPSAVRAWEQGQRSPDGPTRRLLQVIDRSPEALAGIVSGAQDR
jgi:putative transcriptional regulator